MHFLPLLLVISLTTVWASPHHARIIGGSDATIGQFPFAAAISVTKPDGNYFCGGTLISFRYVLTAGICVDKASEFNIVFGSTKRDGSDDSAVNVRATEGSVHPEYDEATLANNVGLIHLNEAVVHEHIRPIIVADDFLQPHTVVTLVGWGAVADEQALSPDLKRAVLVTLNNDECREVYGNQILEGMVCSQGVFHEGACNGDVGGPLIENRGDPLGPTISFLVGVSSFLSGNGCDTAEPSGYTRISSVLDWIESVLGDDQLTYYK